MASKHLSDDSKLTLDAIAWTMNVSTSVFIVFVNKILMDTTYGYKFAFACTLCSFHFLCSGLFVKILEAFGYSDKAVLPWRETLKFSIVASLSIATLNLSLLINSVGLYQVSKLLIIPFTCFLEFMWFQRGISTPALLSIVVVIAGVGLVTVSDVTASPLGLLVAAASVVASGMQQVLCGTMQRQNRLTPNQLLSNTAPVQGIMLLLLGPFIDEMVSGRSLLAFEANLPALRCLMLSCAVAVLVNVSQFMCLGRFSAVTFQVLGHTKTVLVLLLGWLYLGELMTPRKLFGMALAVAGMVAYGSAPKPQVPVGTGKLVGLPVAGSHAIVSVSQSESPRSVTLKDRS